MASTTYYEELGVSPSADRPEIRRAYWSASKALHPDRNPGDTTAEERFKALSTAYETLGNDKKRREYDETLTPGTATSPAAPPSQPTGDVKKEAPKTTTRASGTQSSQSFTAGRSSSSPGTSFLKAAIDALSESNQFTGTSGRTARTPFSDPVMEQFYHFFTDHSFGSRDLIGIEAAMRDPNRGLSNSVLVQEFTDQLISSQLPLPSVRRDMVRAVAELSPTQLQIMLDWSGWIHEPFPKRPFEKQAKFCAENPNLCAILYGYPELGEEHAELIQRSPFTRTSLETVGKLASGMSQDQTACLFESLIGRIDTENFGAERENEALAAHIKSLSDQEAFELGLSLEVTKFAFGNVSNPTRDTLINHAIRQGDAARTSSVVAGLAEALNRSRSQGR